MSLLVLDPWNTSQIFLLEYGKNIILGSVLDKNSRIRHNIEFMYEDKGNGIYYLYTVVNDSTDFKHLYLKMNSNETIREYSKIKNIQWFRICYIRITDNI